MRPATIREIIVDAALAAISMLLALYALLVLSGCGPVPIKVFDEREGRGEREAMDELPPEVEGACAIWGLECYAHPDGNLRGDLVIMVTDDLDSGHGGRELASGWCAKAVWAELRVESLAHEIGHAFGLHHVDDEENLMTEEGYGGEIGHVTDDQIDTVQAAAGRFEGGC